MKRPGSRKHGTKKVLGLVMVVGIIAAGTYAFTAANTVPATKAGDGVGAISGYTVSSVEYTTDAADPSLIDAVRFVLDTAAETVKAQINADSTVTGSADSAWSTCTNIGGSLLDLGDLLPDLTWECTFADYPAEHAGELQVVAYSTTVAP